MQFSAAEYGAVQCGSLTVMLWRIAQFNVVECSAVQQTLQHKIVKCGKVQHTEQNKRK